jgi:hypothetical protein
MKTSTCLKWSRSLNTRPAEHHSWDNPKERKNIESSSKSLRSRNWILRPAVSELSVPGSQDNDEKGNVK